LELTDLGRVDAMFDEARAPRGEVIHLETDRRGAEVQAIRVLLHHLQ
jgi:hypothetical protein